jgi:hypothetical protein
MIEFTVCLPFYTLFMCQLVVTNTEIIGTGWKNCEWRKFEFTADSNEGDAHLKEVGNTRSKEDRPAGLDAHLIKEI